MRRDKRRRGRSDRRGEQRFEAPEHPCHRGSVEKIAFVFEDTAHPPGFLLEKKGEIELGRAVVDREVRCLQPADGSRVWSRALESNQHL